MDEFSKLHPEHLIVVFDMRFLVKRLGDYFQKKGRYISMPTKSPESGFSSESFNYIKGYYPSPNQATALENIFHNPFAYIWGAPGTGKTRFVLANALLHYVRQSKRVLIFAPTNVALEQVLKGVVEFTDQAGIERRNVLRIGNPSREFANSFPEVCEVAGLEKQLKELFNQISIIESILGIDPTSKDLILLDKIQDSEEKIGQLLNQKNQLDEQLSDIVKRKTQLNSDLTMRTSVHQQIREKLQHYEENQGSLVQKIVKAFSYDRSFSGQIPSLTSESSSLEQNVIEIKQKIAESTIDYDRGKKESDSISKTCSQLEEMLTTPSFATTELQQIWVQKNENIVERLKKCRSELLRIKEQTEVQASLKYEYSNYTSEQLKLKLTSYRSEYERLSQLSIEQRIADVLIVGATIDGYVGRFTESDVTFQHVFIDEAAYCNVIKALVAFTINCPVTFLGDHLQLPPVSEMNVDELEGSNEDCLLFLQSSLHAEEAFRQSKQEMLNALRNNQMPGFQLASKADLNETHRFAPNLAAVLNRYVYRNGFCSRITTGTTDIVICHAPKTKGNRKRENPSEAEAIVRYLGQNPSGDIVILSPYRNQVNLIGSKLPELRNEHRIMTVHKSQGQEWDTVILSVCDTSDMWFSDSTNARSSGVNLLNTAVSRAKKKLVIACDADYWRSQPNQLIYGLLQAAT